MLARLILGSALALTIAPIAAAAQDHPASAEPADHAAMDNADASSADEAEVRLVAETTVLLPGYGVGGFQVTTSVPQAQAFFSNGMELNAAFAHSETVAAMQEAVRLDPACAMCLWGEALVSGPTINYGMDSDERVPLLVLARTAERMARRSGTAKERALTAALVTRYRPGPTAQRDDDYAAAMSRVQAQFPDDNEIAVLTADAMFQAASDTWNIDEIRATLPLLEEVLARAPDHTPAVHFYIHATEIVGVAYKAEAYADTLASLAPNASHLVHMPAHTWYWMGRYADAARTNHRAVAIGKANAVQLGMMDHDAFNLPYHAHNVIYGLGGALMAGDSAIALDLARPLIETATGPGASERSAISQLLRASGYFAYARFDPAAVATLAEPDGEYLKAAWHFARGEAAAWNGDEAGVRAESALIPQQISGTPDDENVQPAEQMLGILRGVLDGRAAMLAGDLPSAANAYRTAAEIEESEGFNSFTDPPAFWYPVRRDLAAVLLAKGDLSGAMREAQAALRLRPRDPVAEAILEGARQAGGQAR